MSNSKALAPVITTALEPTYGHEPFIVRAVVASTALVPIVPAPEQADADGIREHATPALAAAAVLHPDAQVVRDLDGAVMYEAPLPPGEHMWIAYPRGGRAVVIVDYSQDARIARQAGTATEPTKARA